MAGVDPNDVALVIKDNVDVLKELASALAKIRQEYGVGLRATTEMYLKIHQWKGKYDKTLMYNETEINHFFIFKVLRNLFLDEVKKKKREFSLESNIVEPYIYDNTFDYIEKEDTIKQSISEWNEYDKRIYEFIFLKGWSMLELSKLTGIEYYSIYRTVKKIKKLLIKQVAR